MAGINEIASVYTNSVTNKNASSAKTNTLAKASAGATTSMSKYGKTIGNAELSDEAAKVYDELKKKYSTNDFILVSKDNIENAKSMASSFANPNKMVVLIDEEKLEKMAQDSDYKKQIENTITAANTKLPELKEAFANNSNIMGFGMQVTKDNRTQFFAMVSKGNQSLNEKLAKKRAEAKEEKKQEAKKAEKKEREEKLEETRKKNKESSKVDDEIDMDDVEIISAYSIEDLIKKVDDYTYSSRADSILSESEQSLGQSIDFKL